MIGFLRQVLEEASSATERPQSMHESSRSRMHLWLEAIREAYITLLPLTVLGAMALSLAQVPSLFSAPPWWTLHLSALAWSKGLTLLSETTIGVMGLFGSMTIAARLTSRLDARARRAGRSLLTVSSISGSVFLLVVLSQHEMNFESLGYASVFQSIVVGIATAELMHHLGRWIPERNDLYNLERTLSLGQALNLSVIALITIAVICASNLLIHLLSAATEPWWMAALAPAPGSPWRQAQWLNPLFALINQGLWSLGINGGQFLLHLASGNQGLIAPPDTLYADHAASLMFLDSYAHLGGAGSTWGLILVCLFKGRDPSLRKLAWYSILPAVLNVNELLLFGIPMVLSRTLFIPFLLAPLLNCLMAEMCIRYLHLGLQGTAVTWSTPVLLSGYLTSGSWIGVAVQIAGLACSALVYAPFIRDLERKRQVRFQANFKSALVELKSAGQMAPASLLERTDSVGVVARKLHGDFTADLGTPRVRMAYQPQHDGRGRIVGFEALLRWEHASLGPIPPTTIVNIAEECELIHTMGRWALRRAAQDLKDWRQQGYEGFVVGINMSPLQLENPGWVAEVQDALRSFGLRSQDIELEITEGQSLSSSAQTEKTLAALQALGIRLSMDDFGMGCTSLLYMHRFKLHTLKLDGNLTRQVLDSPIDQDIIRCVSRLGHSQGSKVVAEYVETAEQQALLEELGCDVFQGWHYSPALPADQVTAYIDVCEARLGMADQPGPQGGR